MEQLPYFKLLNSEFLGDVCIRDNYLFDSDLMRHLNRIVKGNERNFNFHYFTEEEFNCKYSKIKNIEISAFHINICSLNCNNRSLAVLLSTLNFKFDILVLSEV